MPTPQFAELVQHLAISALADSARGRGPAMPQTFGPGEAAAFVDLQNFHYFLKFGCGVNPTCTNQPELIKEFARSHGVNLVGMHFFTGIHSPEREPVKYGAMVRRIHWLRKCGAAVTAIPLQYYGRGSTARVAEKGIDVRLVAELLRCVSRGLRKALIISQDKDIAHSLDVAREMATDLGGDFIAYSPKLPSAVADHVASTGVAGMMGTTHLEMDIALVRKHTRTISDEATDASALPL